MAVIRVNEKLDLELLNSLGYPSEYSEDGTLIEINPNRPDLLSKVSIKRLISLYNSPRYIEYKSEPLQIEFIKDEVPQRNYIEIAVAKIDNLDLEDIIQFQEKLHETFGRKRKRVAIGFHDLSKIVPPIRYTQSDNMRFAPLGGVEMSLDEVLEKTEKGREYKHLVSSPYPVLLDKLGVISMPPIINSERTKLTSDTKEIFIDVTGNNPYYTKKTLDIILSYFIDAGGSVQTLSDLKPIEMKIDIQNIYNLLGEKVDSNLLLKSGILVKGDKVIIPPYRVDIMDETDIAEELAIYHGYSNFVPEYPEIYQESKIIEIPFREELLRLGFSEIVGWYLGNNKLYENFYPTQKLSNALTEEFNSIRPLIEPSLLQFYEKNKMSKLPYKIFEIGHVYRDEKEYIEIGFLISKKEIFVEDFLQVFSTLADLNNLKLEFTNKDYPFYAKNYSFAGKIGNFSFRTGVIKPEILSVYNLIYPVATGVIVLKTL
jgi:phenylalanyl-tRNA synthetase beta chain